MKNLGKQKTEKISKLHLELDAEIKLARVPLVELEAIRDRKLDAFKRETELLLNKEKPVVEELNGAIKLGQAVNATFQTLGVSDSQLKSPALFYVPFYVACYQAGLSERYLFVAPSTANDDVGLSAKLKGAFGMSKIKQIFTPRFKAITALTDQLQTLAQQSDQIRVLGEKNNLLTADWARGDIAKGLVHLKAEGWVSDREYQVLSASLA